MSIEVVSLAVAVQPSFTAVAPGRDGDPRETDEGQVRERGSVSQLGLDGDPGAVRSSGVSRSAMLPIATLLPRSNNRRVAVVGYLVVGALTLAAVAAWWVVGQRRRRDPRAGMRWVWLATVVAVDGWAWWLVFASPWRTSLHLVVLPLATITFLLTWSVVGDLTGVSISRGSMERFEGMVKDLDDGLRR